MNPSETSQALIAALAQGDESAAAKLSPLVYEELRGLAKHIAGGDHAATLQPTALVHEAYLKMVDADSANYKSETHFKAVAAAAMRHVLVDSLRRKGRDKHGAGLQRVTLSDVGGDSGAGEFDCDRLEEVLVKLAALDQRAMRVVELRFFGGLTEEAVASVLGVSDRTVRSDWAWARVWLRRELASS